ncbi:hypothetical protein P691DRAFT_257573 [Macrolepiota fuliginosa MF-IS2]|uniref:Uncharacterized protein n=1 Tax=Macrolepiota fuliginosa MF-IS2 TaxID=1400762 RepID=A0A9P5XN52_9AGAR|nr:hypothetical protein P691DRAFT_257573 [Macrolepiota fuliginosa MF-IS2]
MPEGATPVSNVSVALTPDPDRMIKYHRLGNGQYLESGLSRRGRQVERMVHICCARHTPCANFSPFRQHEEERRRKKEEKESAKRLREQEYRKDEQVREYERERRKSFNAGPPGAPQTGFISFPQGGPPPASPYQTYADPHAGAPQYPPPGSGGSAYGRERKKSNAGGYDTLNRQFDDLNLNREKEYAERERKVSGVGRPRKYSTSAGDAPYGSSYVSQGTASPYGSPYTVPAAPGYAASGGKYSPNPNRSGELPYNPGAGNPVPYPGSAYSSSARGGTDPVSRSTTPYGPAAGAPSQVYPRGHIMEGQPIPPKSRASSPMPGAAPGAAPYGTAYSGYGYPEQPGKIRSHSRPPSPRLGGASPHIPGAILPDAAQQLPPPEAFLRQVNRNTTFTAFTTMKIQNMEEFLLAPHPPRMPLVLKSHDVHPEDWQRLMNDVRLAWSGRLPVPTDSRSGQTPRRTTLVADLVDLWNTSFFLPRGVEVVLYKGRERRSGPKVGTIDRELPEDEDSDRSESESEEDEEDESEFEEYLSRNANAYGRSQGPDLAMIAKRRREAKEEKRRARKEKEAKRRARAKEREKVYALYITNVPIAGAVHAVGGMPGGYTPATTTAYVPSAGGYGRHGY